MQATVTGIPHSRFKAKIMAGMLYITTLGMILVAVCAKYPEAVGAIGLMAAACNGGLGMIAGARAAHQYAAATARKQEVEG
ncbi:MAG: hypothetical protein C4523_09515 [Myxococcales bacterium]|nr:MAG: hypothetical protein C4523_09515 [Myxococcales bacterium]